MLFVTAGFCIITDTCKVTRDVIPEPNDDAVWKEVWHVACFNLLGTNCISEHLNWVALHSIAKAAYSVCFCRVEKQVSRYLFIAPL